MSNYLTQDQIDTLSKSMPAADIVGLGEAIDAAFLGGQRFTATATLTALAATTPVVILDSASVPDGKSVYIQQVQMYVDGANAWTGGSCTKVYVADHSASYIEFAEAAVAGLTGDTYVADTALTYKRTCMAGGAAGIGIVAFADALPPISPAASSIIITVSGVIK